MEYIPKFIYFDYPIDVRYPFGINWNHDYIQQQARIIFSTYKQDISEGISITFVVKGTSGAMIAGALSNELHQISPYVATNILIIRKNDEESCHCCTLYGIESIHYARFIVVDDFISSGKTVEAIIKELDTSSYLNGHPLHSIRYDMLCISNTINAELLEKGLAPDNKVNWENILSRFEYVVCNKDS